MTTNHRDTPLSMRNAVLGITNGAVFQVAQAALDPETVLTAFALSLFEGNVLAVGILASTIASGWYLPGAFLAPLFARRERLLPVYRFSAAARAVSAIALWAIVQYSSNLSPTALFAIVAVCLFSITSWGGVGLVPFYSIVSDTVPATWRGKFFGARWFLGGLLGFGVGVYAKHVLSADSGLDFPQNYGRLFLLAMMGLVVSSGAFCFAEERPRSVQRRRLPYSTELIRGPRFFRRDTTYRRATRARALFATLTGLSYCFIVPYGLLASNMTPALVGVYLAIRTLADSSSNLLWSRLSDSRGNLLVLRLSGMLALLVVGGVLCVPLVPEVPLSGGLGFAVDTRVAWILGLAIPVGFSRSGGMLGHNNFLLEISPPRVRATYLGFYYAVLFPLSWVPLVGSLIIGAGHRFTLGFAIAGVVGLLMVADLLRLREVRQPQASAEDDGL